MTQDTMHKAYRLADELMKDRLKEQAPDLLKEMEQLEQADILITVGEYDHIQQVLDVAGTPYTMIQPSAVQEISMRPDQILFVNCAGRMDARSLRKVRTFVEEGGFLFTTDWALKHVLEPAFPGFVEYNGRATGDEVVRVEIIDREDPLLGVLMGPEDDPQWWLEGSSYPIRILNPEAVRVIITSRELGERYGEPAVFVTFEVGRGRVYHMISHFYLQRSETRTRRHALSSADYLKEKGISPELHEKYMAMGAGAVNLGSVESAFASHGVVSSILLEKKRQMEQMRERMKRSSKKADEEDQSS